MTATKTGAAVDPGSREYNWVRTIVELVEKNTGQSSRWNGKLHLEEGDALGTAHADGTMTVSDTKVLEPLRKAFAGQPLSDDEQFLLRDALVTLTHESLHLAGTIVDEHGQVRYTDADAALEEGLTETWAQQNVDHAIYALGLDRTYPGLVNQGAVDAYPALQAASNKLVAGVATLSGLRETEVVRRMQATPVHERFEVLADLAIEQRMSGVVGAEKTAVRAELLKSLHEQFGKLMAIQDDDTLDYTSKAQQGSVIGSLALTSFSQALLQAEHTHPQLPDPPDRQWPAPTATPWQPPPLQPSPTTPQYVPAPAAHTAPQYVPAPAAHTAPQYAPAPAAHTAPQYTPAPPAAPQPVVSPPPTPQHHQPPPPVPQWWQQPTTHQQPAAHLPPAPQPHAPQQTWSQPTHPQQPQQQQEQQQPTAAQQPPYAQQPQPAQTWQQPSQQPQPPAANPIWWHQPPSPQPTQPHPQQTPGQHSAQQAGGQHTAQQEWGQQAPYAQPPQQAQQAQWWRPPGGAQSRQDHEQNAPGQDGPGPGQDRPGQDGPGQGAQGVESLRRFLGAGGRAGDGVGAGEVREGRGVREVGRRSGGQETGR